MSADSLAVDEDVLRVLQELRTGGALDAAVLARRLGLDQAKVTLAAGVAAEKGWVTVSERPREELVAGPGAAEALEAGLPERRALQALAAAGGALSMAALVDWSKSSGVPTNEVIRWGLQKGWMRREGDPSGDKSAAQIVLTEAGRQARAEESLDERALRKALGGTVFLDQLAEEGLDPEGVREALGKRSDLVRIKPRVQRIMALSEGGLAALDRGVQVARKRNSLTAEDLQSGAWREILLRPYDVTLPAREVYPAKTHPLRRIMEETRHAFLEMGFTEVASPMVEAAFWNFDALYQPQDHPARDMQDTFYMAQPSRVELPAADLVERVRLTHENGWETGSEGWGYRWDAEQARRVVLRTHTTAATIRALARHPEPPLKVFCVGWTFRNETISYKHLPVFHQVDGVVIDAEANLATLLGTLREFYRKMGFDRVKFKPAFYPYTEPSADVVVYMPSRGRWIEMGGSGIFRPEVTRPFGCKYPVLAWGLGIERLAMLRLGFESIRELYAGGLDRLQEVPLCR